MTHSPHTEATPATLSTLSTLDDRIRLVELRLIAREERLWRGVTELQARARESLQPRRLLRPLAMAGGVGLACAAAWWLLRRSRPGRHPTQRPHVDPRSHPRSHWRSNWRSRVVAAVGLLTVVPWAPVMGLIWPLLPTRLKQRATPGGAAATLSVALPWLAKFAAPQGSLGLLRLWLTSLNGMWEGLSGIKQRAGRPRSAGQVGPG